MGTGLMRKEGWEGRLNAVIDNSLQTPFEWGRHDCSLFAMRCTDAVYGTEIEGKHCGRYKTARGAAGRVKRAGGFNGALTGEGFTSLATAFAQRGDLVVVDQDGREALGVVLSGRIAAVGIDGLVFIPMDRAIEVWCK